jgi:hypothetical protein
MARTVATLPAESRITDYISLGVIAMFFPLKKVREVLRCLLKGAEWLLDPSAVVKVAGKSGISQARTRLGPAPLRELYKAIVVPIAEKRARGAWYRQWRLVSLDGSTLDTADTAEIDEAFGGPGAGRRSSAYPKLRFVAMEECCVWRIASSPATSSGRRQPRTGADLLWRSRRNARLDVERRLPDGSYLSRIHASISDRRNGRRVIVVRVIDYPLKGVPSNAQVVLRSKTPELVEQEFWKLPIANFVIRGLIHEAR